MFAVDPRHLQKVELLQFWSSFGGKQNNGIGFTEVEKLTALIRLSKIKYFHRTKSLRRLRKHFNKNYKSMFTLDCFVCSRKSQHRHHLIQLQYGGINSKLNRIPLCRNCHVKIHPWMIKKEDGESATHLYSLKDWNSITI